ncbi:MAG: mechanosensitive ion channel family protein [Candidatus Marinarcus sp.]|uniref:mechanosensitive ion channel family protein n=1 Tax=Candidatus Marinarcus sp. TaxID=3100987 RepID=UPI003AFFE4E1
MDIILEYVLNIIYALLIFVIGKWLVKEITGVAVKFLRKNPKLDATLINFFEDIIYYVLLIVVILSALEEVGVETTSFLAIIGAAGLAVGLALKDSLSNFASGVMLIFFKPFRIGDVVTAGGVTGKITEIHLFNTEFTTGDNQMILVPNSAITAGSITNINAHDKRRVDLTIGIGYDDDIKKAKEILTKIITANEKVLVEDGITVAVGELADSSVNFVVRAWVNTPDYWDVKFALTENIKMTFDEEGISIPYPQTDVHLFKEKK